MIKGMSVDKQLQLGLQAEEKLNITHLWNYNTEFSSSPPPFFFKPHLHTHSDNQNEQQET